MINLCWYKRKTQKFAYRYEIEFYWARQNTAEYFACGIDEPEKEYYRKIIKDGKLVCREAEYNGI